MVKEKRKYERYDTYAKIYFHVTYDIATKVKFRVIDKVKNKALTKKYEALSKNVSAEGLCFSSAKQLNKGDILYMEVYLPVPEDKKTPLPKKFKKPILMEGEVRWSQASKKQKKETFYDTGVKLITVNGKAVDESVFLDAINKVVWSVVLESIFGKFKITADKYISLRIKSNTQ